MSEREVTHSNTGVSRQLHRVDQSLSQILEAISRSVPAEGLTLRELVGRLGERGLLLLLLVLTLPFSFPFSIPGTSTPFGLLIVVQGFGSVDKHPVCFLTAQGPGLSFADSLSWLTARELWRTVAPDRGVSSHGHS
jgi:exopolysaccharide synthesis protein ExoD